MKGRGKKRRNMNRELKGKGGSAGGLVWKWKFWLVCAGILFLISFFGGALWEHFQEAAGYGADDGECVLCMARNRAKSGIGIWNLHTGRMLLLNGEAEGGGSEIDMMAGEEGSSVIARSYGRGITQVQVLLTESSAWEENELPEGLCASCLEKLALEWADEAADGYDIVLVDLRTLNAVQLENRRRALSLGDSFLHFDYDEDRVELLIFHAPDA